MRSSFKAIVAVTLGMSLFFIVLWVLGSATQLTAYASALGPNAVQQEQVTDQSHLLQASNAITVCPAAVGTCDYADIQAAVDAANKGDVIKVSAGTYAGVQHRPSPPGYHGPATIQQTVYISKSITIRGGYTVTNDFADPPDPLTNPSILDAQGQGRVLFVTGDISPTIEGLKIVNGDATGLGGTGNQYGTYAVGGGVCVLTATATLSNVQVVSNTVDSYGGGVYLGWDGSRLISSTIVSNSAPWGGGIYLDHSSAAVEDNTVTGNTSSIEGGGLYLAFSPATFQGNRIIDNYTNGGGGGLYLISSDAILNANIVFSNTAASYGSGLGGGLYLYWSDATLVNNVIAGNRADTTGCGLYLIASSPHLLHNTVANNWGGDSSGLHVTIFSPSDNNHVYLTNTVLVSQSIGISVTWGNTVTVNGILWHTTPVTVSMEPLAAANVLNEHIGDPCFTNPSAGDYHICGASAAVSKGVNAGVVEDIDGDPRPQGGWYDLGADEYMFPFESYLPLVLRRSQ